jgi:hypothetical protein
MSRIHVRSPLSPIFFQKLELCASKRPVFVGGRGMELGKVSRGVSVDDLPEFPRKKYIFQVVTAMIADDQPIRQDLRLLEGIRAVQ